MKELKLLMTLLVLDGCSRKEPPVWLFVLPCFAVTSVTAEGTRPVNCVLCVKMLQSMLKEAAVRE